MSLHSGSQEEERGRGSQGSLCGCLFNFPLHFQQSTLGRVVFLNLVLLWFSVCVCVYVFLRGKPQLQWGHRGSSQPLIQTFKHSSHLEPCPHPSIQRYWLPPIPEPLEGSTVKNSLALSSSVGIQLSTSPTSAELPLHLCSLFHHVLLFCA